jgi:RHS repeat-associated protein
VIYVPTGSGKEHQTLFSYDDRHRLTGITQQLCTISSGHSCSSTVPTGSDTYVYDDNDNWTRVNESNGSSSLDRYYCYDALEQLITTRSATGCSSGLLETYAYDDSGNRTAAPSASFTYDGEGQLATCSPSCGASHDTAGRISKLYGWAFEYDGQGRITRACQSSTDCAGNLNELEFTYDGEGHRTQIKQYDSGSGTAVATWDFRYQGDAIVEEKLTDGAHPSGSVVRSYIVDSSGSVMKMAIAAGETGAGTYLVTWNGHGDARALWRINGDGTLTLANSYTYTTWGAPTTTTHNSIPDLGFRFLYVGASGVGWDNIHGLGLAHMGARHYSPAIGRFLQPDPSAQEDNLYEYAGNSPLTFTDPDGLRRVVTGGGRGSFGFGSSNPKGGGGGGGAKAGGGGSPGAGNSKGRFVPNPYGRLGSPAHRARIFQARDRLLAKGAKLVSGGGTPEAKYGGRYPDLVVEWQGQRIAIQVGRVTRGGQPVARERYAITDLRALPDFSHVFYLGY